MELKQPFNVYTAATNVEAHTIVAMLSANDIPAQVIEDQSGASIWGGGTISQFHKPNIWVEKSDAQQAAALIAEFEETNRDRRNPTRTGDDIHVGCEECGRTTTFPDSLAGTTQQCRHCHAYVDVEEA